MTWRVIHARAFNDWREPDETIRDQMLDWFFELVTMMIFRDTKPPMIAIIGIRDPLRS